MVIEQAVPGQPRGSQTHYLRHLKQDPDVPKAVSSSESSGASWECKSEIGPCR